MYLKSVFEIKGNYFLILFLLLGCTKSKEQRAEDPHEQPATTSIPYVFETPNGFEFFDFDEAYYSSLRLANPVTGATIELAKERHSHNLDSLRHEILTEKYTNLMYQSAEEFGMNVLKIDTLYTGKTLVMATEGQSKYNQMEMTNIFHLYFENEMVMISHSYTLSNTDHDYIMDFVRSVKLKSAESTR